ncbi:chorismate mutase [Serratia rubidaea]|uniref:chorismate mutase n=1 Tax=Serratia rubidaea TaxID=61652 RepID=UPI000773CAA2|nr:chorismate mutase [Serratia rubidaea]AML58925.1 Periplasmic chorismate mutase I precursor [Serratia rubidaea]WBF43614.1 chorismate mutase [Serratia rubidaea]
MLKICLMAGLLCSFSALADNSASIADVVNQRLALMKDVAGYKAQQHLPIEDLAQESKVLANTQAQAEKLGLEPQSVKPFIVAQMDAAKAIQYRYRADWLAQPETDWQPQPLEKVRPEIARLSDKILQRLAQRLRQGPIAESERQAFIQAIQQVNLTAADKQRLFDALLMVKLNGR